MSKIYFKNNTDDLNTPAVHFTSHKIDQNCEVSDTPKLNVWRCPDTTTTWRHWCHVWQI